MRIDKLKLTNYGVFKNSSFDFNKSPFVLVYGPNEAGKSTLLQSLRESLFGMSTSSEITGPRTLAEVSATFANGEEIHYRRRRGRKDLVEGEYGSGSKKIDETQLLRLLGPLDVNAYRSLFGFSLEELSRGQQSLAGLSLTEALLGVKRGASLDWKTTKKSLVERRDKLMTAQGRTQEILKLIGQIRELQKSIDAATTLPQSYLSTRQQLDSVDARHALLSRELKELTASLDSCDRLGKALPIAQQLTTERSKLKQFVVPEQLTRAWNDQWRHYQSQIEQITQTEIALNREVAEIEAEVERTTQIDTPCVEIDTIRRLAIQAVANDDLKSQLEMLQSELREVVAKEKELADTIDPEIVSVLPSEFQVTRIMKDDLRDIVEQIREATRTAAVLDSRIAETRAAMEKLGSAVQEPEERAENLSSLNELIHGCRDFLRSIHLFQQTHARANREAAEVEKINVQLVDVTGELFEQVHVDLLPIDSTIEELATNWCNSQQEYESLDRQHKQAIRTLEEIRSTKEKLADERPIASLENLRGMRVRRKELWDQLQTLQYQSSKEQDSLFGIEIQNAVQLYWDHLAQEDAMVDSILANVQEFALREQHATDFRKAISEVEQLASQLRDAKSKYDSAQSQWQQVWQACSVVPREPSKMRSVSGLLRRRHELGQSITQSHADSESLSQRWRELETKIDVFHPSDSLTESESRSPKKVSVADASTPLTIRVADLEDEVQSNLNTLESFQSNAIKSEATRAANQNQFVILQTSLQSLESERVQAIKSHETFFGHYRNSLNGYHLPESIKHDDTLDVLGRLEELSTLRKDGNQLKNQIAQLEKTIESFYQEIEQALRTEPSIVVSDKGPENVAQLLQVQEKLNQVAMQREALQKLATRNEEKRKQLAANGKDRGDKMSALETLAKLLGLENVEQAQALSKKAEEYWVLMAAVSERERQLEAFAHGRSLDAFMGDLAATSEQGIQQNDERLQSELQEKQKSYDRLLIEKGNLEQQLRQMVDDERVTRMTMELESLQAKLDEMSREWMVLATSILLLDRSLEEFRKNQQGAIMELVRKNFSKLTMGRYIDVQADRYAEHTFHVVDHDQETKKPEQLSQGTREQLYLALRFAFVQQYCGQHEPLPIVMDDCFVNFDDNRLAQTLEAVHHICKESQCIVLSCHRRTVDAVRQIVPDAHIIVLKDPVNVNQA